MNSMKWIEGENFSGKRPFGNSCWECDVEFALVQANIIEGEIDEDGYLERCDSVAANQIILAAIDSLEGN